MKKLIVFFVILAMISASCNNYFVVKRDPTVLNSSIILSGEVTGDIYPEVRTMRMRASGQASNFLLLEIYGMESFCNTTSIEVLDSLAGDQLYLSLIDDGTPGTERCYRNVQFWVGPFDSNNYYTLHLSEAQSAIGHDDLSLTFQYDQHLDISVTAEDCYYLLSEYPFDSLSVRDYESSEIPGFNYVDYIHNIDTIQFFDTDSGLLVRTILDMDCDVTHSASNEIDGDTLFMNINLGPAGITGCNKLVFFDYLIKDYDEQTFYYQFYLTNSDWSIFEGIYTPDN